MAKSRTTTRPGAAPTVADHNRGIGIHAVNLKHRLRTIETISPKDGSPQRSLLRRSHPRALRCRNVGAVQKRIGAPLPPDPGTLFHDMPLLVVTGVKAGLRIRAEQGGGCRCGVGGDDIADVVN